MSVELNVFLILVYNIMHADGSRVYCIGGNIVYIWVLAFYVSWVILIVRDAWSTTCGSQPFKMNPLHTPTLEMLNFLTSSMLTYAIKFTNTNLAGVKGTVWLWVNGLDLSKLFWANHYALVYTLSVCMVCICMHIYIPS